MTILQIRYFVEVAKSSNFTEASNRLFVSQQGISKQIASLEKEVGTKLLERTTKYVRLTKGGQILHNAWQEILQKHDAAMAEALKIEKKQQTQLRVGIADVGSLVDFVHQHIDTFLSENPEIDLDYKIYSFRRLREMLQSGNLDLIISLSSELEAFDIQKNMCPLLDMELGIVLSDRHPLGKMDVVTLQDLKDEVFYLFADTFSDDAEKRILAHLLADGIVPKEVRYFDSARSMELALYSGKGVTIGYNLFFNTSGSKLRFHKIPYGRKTTLGEADGVVAAWQDDTSGKAQKFVHSLLNSAK